MGIISDHLLADEFGYSEDVEKAGIELYKAVRDLQCCVNGALTRVGKAMGRFKYIAPQAEKQWQRESVKNI